MSETTIKKGVQILIEAMLQHGIKDVVFSPGSRNAPLVIGIVGSGKFNTISLPDERSAAFFALGMAQQTKKPVPVMCTSGSALLNYAPAVAEAYYQRVPFIVISADRPLEWIDQGDGQTINQNGVFSNFIDYQISLPVEPQVESQEWFYHREIQTAFNKAQFGPVHINIPFEEPLYTRVLQKASNASKMELMETRQQLSDTQLGELHKEWNRATKRMILIGQHVREPRFFQALEPFLNDPDTAILVENTSSIVHFQAVHCIDRTLACIEGEEEQYTPDLFLVFGGAVVSKKIKSFLRNRSIRQQWKVGVDFQFMDTYQHLTRTIPMHSAEFLEQFAQGLTFLPESNFGSLWKKAEFNAQQIHIDTLPTIPFSDLKVMEIVLDTIPEKSHLHLGNSSIVRYAQLFDPLKFVDYWCNRGTSGIDGCVSTALGAAFANKHQIHTLIVGDISFFYDSNALWNKYLTSNCRIVVVHNGGGGIFKIIPGPDTTEQLDDYFVTQHDFSAEYICKAFDITYHTANSIETLEQGLVDLYQPTTNNRPALLEVFTPSDVNDKQLKSYFNSIRNVH
jgi:2-succinyl-5-enolpyruvyl-6-hydroxy-3-cyclohexene-1-carboxylate synthase